MTNSLAHDRRQLGGGVHGTRCHDGMRNAARTMLFPIAIDDVRNLGFVGFIHKVSCCHAVLGHPHVQRTVLLK